MRTRRLEKFEILVGLPGSGKTYFANSQNKLNTSILDFDSYKNQKTHTETKNWFIKQMNLAFNTGTGRVICDGLFPDMIDIEWVLDILFEKFKAPEYVINEILIHYWNPDGSRDDCLWNDIGRRTMSSTNTIKTLNIPKPNVQQIERKYKVPTRLIRHNVVRKPNYLVLAGSNRAKLQDDKYICSNTWLVSGEVRSWDGEHPSPLSPEPPVEFVELDDFLEGICPAITFLQYKKIWRECVCIQEKYDNDYYSSSTLAYFSCDVEKMYSLLKDWGLTSI